MLARAVGVGAFAAVAVVPSYVGAAPPGSTVPVATEPPDASAGAVPAAAEQTGPTIRLDRTEVRAGEPVIVTMVSFTSQQVTVAVCGNLAKRGSEDCNMPQAQSERVRPNEPETLTQLFIEPPPVACPCIVRALGTNGEFAIAPLDLIDHPVEPIVSPDLGALVEVELGAQRVKTNLSGRIRTGLGATTAHAVTVSVRNITTEPLANVVVRARVSHRLSDDVAPVRFDVPGPIEPGQTWSQTIEVELPAPYMGQFTWSASVAGAGPTVDATYVTDAVPAILYTFVAVLVLDIVVLLARAILRLRRRAGRPRRRRRPSETHRAEPIVLDDREPVGVG
jgi:hypothetical protein